MEILIQNDYRVVNLTDGALLNEAINIVNDRKADGINFNFIRNFPSSIEGIENAQNIKHIQVNDYSWDFDYDVIHRLSTLESIAIYTSDKKEINFKKFPLLKNVAITWRPKAISIFECVKLERLFLGKYNGLDLQLFEPLIKLKYLRINTGSLKRLNGIEKFSNLESLMLMQASKLETIVGIEKLSNLKYLRIDNCRNVQDVYRIGSMPKSTEIVICGTTPRPE